MWTALLRQYWQVSLFRRSPANTPYLPSMLMSVALIFYALISWQWGFVNEGEALDARFQIMAGITLTASYSLYTSILLHLFKCGARIVQTLTCLYASHIIIHLFAFPVLLSTHLLSDGTLTHLISLMIAILYLLSTIALTLWQFMVTVHIYKLAINVDYIAAVLASFGLFALNVLMVSFWR